MSKTTFVVISLLLAACVPPTPAAAPPTVPTTATSAPVPVTAAPPTAAACQSTDQDQYVYHPARLTVLAACLRVTGTVAAIRTEADGDEHILLRLDGEYLHLLTPANQGEELGDLVIEPVCERKVTQADAVATCASDHDPINVAELALGMRVWMEGRYVLDTEHGGWAELHPLYKFGPMP